MLIDHFGRSITYLRISVTDRCNLRCVYCMPAEGVTQLAHQDILQYEEIAVVAAAAARLGIRSVRLTGGEPLVRRDLPELIRMLAEIPGIEDISLTTNGILLGEMAASLAAAGLKRVNVSLDTFDAKKFREITRGGSVDQVWQGIAEAERIGLHPIKLNVVAMRGVNDDELLDFARLTLTHDWDVRFIELMPIENQAPWGPGFPQPGDIYMPVEQIRQKLEPLGIEPVERQSAGFGPAREYRVPGAPGRIGLISPVGEHFCGTCNRLRLTSDGNLRPCLLSDFEIPIRTALRSGKDLTAFLLEAVAAKPAGHELALAGSPNGAPYGSANGGPHGRCMRQIGG